MATSVQVVGQDAAALNDLDLLLLLQLMVEQVKSRASRFPALQLLADQWKLNWECYGPGTIDLELAEIASDTSKKAEFLCLVSELRHRLQAQGAVLDRAVINERWGIRGVEFSDYSTERLILVLEKLQALVAR